MITHMIWGYFVPHIFVWGSCFWFCPPVPPSAASSFSASSVTHNFVAHNLSYTTLLHTIFHTKSLYTQPFHTHTLHFTHSFTYNIVTHTHNLSLSRRALSHAHTHTNTQLFHTQLYHTQFFQTICLPPAPIYFPISFHTCFELVGRS